MSFNVTCTPGKDAAAGYVRVAEHLPALVIYLDPVNVAVQLPPFLGGEALLARFCRELAREAIKLADAVDPGDAPIYSAEGPRRALSDDGEAGGDE